MFFSISIIILVSMQFSNIQSFIPVESESMDDFIEKMNKMFDNQLGYVSKSYTHQKILRKGLIKSITGFLDEIGIKYKYDSGSDEFEYDPDSIKIKSKKRPFCKLTLKSVLGIMEAGVAVVDTDTRYKDLPWAHYDANTFNESTERVRKYIENIKHKINDGDYTEARKLIGEVLHTIHDFYSHSNWVEMGNEDINYKITSVKDISIGNLANIDDQTCFDNCTLIELPCKISFDEMTKLAKKFSKDLKMIQCPLKYFKCESNVITDKLTSGYYTNQYLPDGSQVLKPSNKCSHGGLFDSTSFQTIQGGINKDNGYIFLSPHAQFHRVAAKLAIKHTEYFFNSLRKTHGKAKYINLLGLNVKHDDSLTCLPDKLIFIFE